MKKADVVPCSPLNRNELSPSWGISKSLVKFLMLSWIDSQCCRVFFFRSSRTVKLPPSAISSLMLIGGITWCSLCSSGGLSASGARLANVEPMGAPSALSVMIAGSLRRIDLNSRALENGSSEPSSLATGIFIDIFESLDSRLRSVVSRLNRILNLLPRSSFGEKVRCSTPLAVPLLISTGRVSGR